MSLFVHLLIAVPRDVKNKNMSLVQYGAQFCFSFHCGYFLLCVFGSFASLFVFLAHFHLPGHHVVSAVDLVSQRHQHHIAVIHHHNHHQAKAGLRPARPSRIVGPRYR